MLSKMHSKIHVKLLLLMQLAASHLLVNCVLGEKGAKTVSTADGNNRCEWLETAGKGLTRFSVLPGSGWDNLRNRDMAMVADMSFSDCTLSDDGTYVIPRHVILYPKRESQISMVSHIMEHYENYTSSTSVSVNLGGNGIIHGFSLDGKMSDEFQSVKKTALSSKTQIGRTQQRYNMFTAQLQPDFKLSESFANRLVDIGDAIINNRSGMVRYLADLLVRDFGTHVVTSVDAGAILEKLDYFNRNSLSSSSFTSNKVSICMSVGFAKVFGVNFDSSITVTDEEFKQYINSVQKTTVNTHGGPPIGAKINIDDWESHLRENLVAIDKIGDPIFGVITERNLPQIPVPYLKDLIESVKNAVLRYYKANEIKGCLDPNSPSFDSLANIEGICNPTLTNFSFAGVYQTCQESNPGLGLGLCGRGSSPVQKNPITGDFSCPQGYESVKFVTAVGDSGTRCFRRSKSCWLFFSCDDGQDCYNSQATLNSYWCSAVNGAKLPQDSGMVYGGAYSPRFNNPFTDEKSCGAGYRPYTIARDISLCLSSDMSNAAASRVPLGGFFSCQWGNPLADPGRQVVTSSGHGPSSAARDSFYSSSPPLKRCPDGFSQSTVDLVDGCALMQCTKGPSDVRPAVTKRPPFEEADYRFFGPPVTWLVSDGRSWAFNGTTWVYLGYSGGALRSDREAGSMSAPSLSGESGQRSGLVIGGLVAILATIGLVIVSALAFAYRNLRRRRRDGRGAYRQLDEAGADSLIESAGIIPGEGRSGAGYGAVNVEAMISERQSSPSV